MKKETSIIPCCNPKIRLLPGLYRDPAGELTTLPRLPSRGLPSPDPSHSTPSAPRLPRGAEGAYVISYEDSGLPPFFIQEPLLISLYMSLATMYTLKECLTIYRPITMQKE